MSFYRNLLTAVAVMGLTTAVFAADEASVAGQSPATDAQAVAPTQLADAQSTESQSTDQSSMSSADQSAKVNVNTATAKELMKVKGLSASKAKAIVAFRKKHGDFKSLDDLKQVRGFKKMDEQSMKTLQDQLTIG